MNPYQFVAPACHPPLVGNWATLLLTTSRENIDYSRLADEIDILISAAPNGIYSNGTSGEFYTLSESEFDAVNLLLAEKCTKYQVPFQIGVSHTRPQQLLDRLKRTVALRPCAVQVTLPDWFPATKEGAVDFLQSLASAAEGVGLVLYNPPHAKRRLEPEDWKYLKERVPQLIGLKVFDNNGDEEWYARMRKCSKGLSVFIPGHRMVYGVQRGAQGAYSNVACLNPFAAQRWYEKTQTNMLAAMEQELRINQFMDQYIAPLISLHRYSNPACDRFMALLGGWTDIGAYMRWPYRSVPPNWAYEMRPLAKNIIPEFFAKY